MSTSVPPVSRRTALRAGAAAALGIGAAALEPRAAYAAPLGDGVRAESPFGANYLARGTVFTRDARELPLAPNSAAIARHVAAMPERYVAPEFKPWLRTSLNTTHFNIPIYLVDSTAPRHDTARVTVSRIPNDRLRAAVSGTIALPVWAEPAEGGDGSLAVYDLGTGLMREYFGLVRTGDRQWQASWAGYYQAEPGLAGLASRNYAMQLQQGSGAVVGMLSPLAQIGIDEVRTGRIEHAVAVTLANASSAGASWPARQSDGTDPDPHAPRQGQWFRLPADLDLAALKLSPLTTMIARAVQTYGGFGSDKNLWCHAFNCEHPATEIRRTGRNPWATGGELERRLGSLQVNDFPWHLTEWCAVDARSGGPAKAPDDTPWSAGTAAPAETQAPAPQPARSPAPPARASWWNQLVDWVDSR